MRWRWPETAVAAFVVLYWAVPGACGAQTGERSPPTFRVPETATSIRVDGVLDDAAWKEALRLELPYEIDPGENLPARMRTECWLTTDPGHLFAACHAYDPAPTAIRAHYADRDAAWDDDWILLELDTFFDQRRAFQFLVNPLGVQMDCILNEVGGGESEVDSTWDAIWASAGRLTSDGYVVEIAIPFSSLRFPRVKGPQRWGFQAVRHCPRDYSYFFRILPWDRNQDCTLCENLTLVGFASATPARNLELDPTLTASRTDPGGQGGHPEEHSAALEPGLSVRWGITPNVSVNAAINPDFSHIEADAAQLEVNTRFSLFYPEKRPFFLEGADLFENVLRATYTRTMAEPRWGIKLTGKERGHAFGVLSAEDERSNLLIPGNQESGLVSLPGRTVTHIIRYRRDIGQRSTLGALYTDRSGDHYFNRVFGSDGLIQLSPTDRIHFQLLGSRSSYPDELVAHHDQPADPFGGLAISFDYRHEARNWHWWGAYDHLERNFRADSGFIPRVDVKTTRVGLRRIVWRDSEDVLSKLSFTAAGARTTDQKATLTDRSLALSAQVNGPMLSSLSVGLSTQTELFRGAYYDLTSFTSDFRIQPNPSLNLSMALHRGDSIDYTGARPADRIRVNPMVTVFAGRHLQVQLDHTLERLDVEAGRLYTANLTRARMVYQFNLRTFARAIVQNYRVGTNRALQLAPGDPNESHLLVQLLFSYKVNPRSLLFVGYSENRWRSDPPAAVPSNRTLFFKISYAWLL